MGQEVGSNVLAKAILIMDATTYTDEPFLPTYMLV